MLDRKKQAVVLGDRVLYQLAWPAHVGREHPFRSSSLLAFLYIPSEPGILHKAYSDIAALSHQISLDPFLARPLF